MRYEITVIYRDWPSTEALVLKRTWSLKPALLKAEEVVKHGFLRWGTMVYDANRIVEVRIYKNGNIVDIVKGAQKV